MPNLERDILDDVSIKMNLIHVKMENLNRSYCENDEGRGKDELSY